MSQDARLKMVYQLMRGVDREQAEAIVDALRKPRVAKEESALCSACKKERRVYRPTARSREVGPPEPGFKWCPNCQAFKPLSEFPPDPRMKLGLHSYCRPCRTRSNRRASERRKERKSA